MRSRGARLHAPVGQRQRRRHHAQRTAPAQPGWLAVEIERLCVCFVHGFSTVAGRTIGQAARVLQVHLASQSRGLPRASAWRCACRTVGRAGAGAAADRGGSPGTTASASAVRARSAASGRPGHGIRRSRLPSRGERCDRNRRNRAGCGHGAIRSAADSLRFCEAAPTDRRAGTAANGNSGRSGWKASPAWRSVSTVVWQ